MLLFIILLGIVAFGIYLVRKSYKYEELGFVIALIFGIYLIIHILIWSLSSYDYNKFITKRQAFAETLEYARRNQSQFELASITKDISEWNKELASRQYDNTVFLLQDYVDNRTMDLKPIR